MTFLSTFRMMLSCMVREVGLHFHPHPLDWLHYETSFETVTATKQNGIICRWFLPTIEQHCKSRIQDQELATRRFASFNVNTTLNQKNNVSGFETPMAILLVNPIRRNCESWENSFWCQPKWNNLLDKSYIAHLSRLKTDGIPNIEETWFWESICRMLFY
jgi:iron complex outermembrane receptor protein